MIKIFQTSPIFNNFIQHPSLLQWHKIIIVVVIFQYQRY